MPPHDLPNFTDCAGFKQAAGFVDHSEEAQSIPWGIGNAGKQGNARWRLGGRPSPVCRLRHARPFVRQ
jgi:hypothetical protein